MKTKKNIPADVCFRADQ